MLASRNRNRIGNGDHWPGFVDALSSLLLVFIFLLSIFVLAQFFLNQVLSGQDEELTRLNNEIARLAQELSLARAENEDLISNTAALLASLSAANAARDEAQAELASLQDKFNTQAALLTELEGRGATMAAELEAEREISQKAQDQVALLNQQLAALRAQLKSLQEALDASEARDKEQQAIIADLGKRLNVALAQKVQELAQYRSEFFGELRKALAGTPGILIEGDRFIMQSEVLFASGSAELSVSGLAELDKLANTLKTVSPKIPPDIRWILRVDGHTDPLPIRTAQFPSNWELSTARATAVVRYLIEEGIPPRRLAATGFGEFQPIAPGLTAESNRRNRRIEFKLTER